MSLPDNFSEKTKALLRDLSKDTDLKKILTSNNISSEESKAIFADLLMECFDEPSAVPEANKSASSVEKLVIYVDGASRGNNVKGAKGSLAGAGAYVTDEKGVKINEVKKFLGSMTNNGAEYSSLVIALKEACRLKAKEVKIVADSELMVKQMKGIYKVKSDNIKALYNEAKELSSQFDVFEITHTLRENNKEADRLANEAIDNRQ